MNLTIVFLSILLIASAKMVNAVKKGELDPANDEVMIPGTMVPVEEMNTAPTSPSLQKDELENRTILEAREEEVEELQNKELFKRKKK